MITLLSVKAVSSVSTVYQWACGAGANVLAADEEAETCLHLAFARHTTPINLDQADAIQRVYSLLQSFNVSIIITLCADQH